MSDAAAVNGERTVARAAGSRSLAIRAQRALALVFVGTVGAGVLTWYYLSLAADSRAGPAGGTLSARSAAASEMKLPALARLPAPVPRAAPASEPEPPETVPYGATRSVEDPPAAHGRAAPVSANDALARMSSPVLVRQSVPAPPAAPAGLGDLALLARAAALPEGLEHVAGTSPGPPPEPAVASPVQAAILPTRRWLLAKGSFLDCTLETAIDSTLPGMATCVLATDAFGADGRVVLLERGTKLVGEARSDVRAGQARVAVLWAEARTPTGVTVALASPGTDALGRAGIPGAIDAHFGTRFGAAILLSLIDGAVSAVAAHGSGTGLLVYGMQGSHDVATETLRATINVPPTIRVPPGARIQVLVARDVDFRRVYRLATRGEP